MLERLRNPLQITNSEAKRPELALYRFKPCAVNTITSSSAEFCKKREPYSLGLPALRHGTGADADSFRLLDRFVDLKLAIYILV